MASGVDLSLAPGASLGLAGGNGSGKTTLLRTLLGLQRPLAGSVERGPGFRPGYLPQRDAIDPVFPFRAVDVVLMGARPEAWLPFSRARERRRDAEEAMERTGVADVAAVPFRDLSGGQKQRVLLARALAARPTALALDEPTTGLDPAAEAALLGLLRDLRGGGMTLLVVSHALHLLAAACTDVVLLHEGRHRAGPTGQVLTEAALADLYGAPVRLPRGAPGGGDA